MALLLGCILTQITLTEIAMVVLWASNPGNHLLRKSTDEIASGILDLVRSDVCGLMHVESDGGARHMLTHINDQPRMTITYFIKNKHEVLGKIKEYLRITENFTGRKLKCLRSGNGREYISKEFLQITGNNTANNCSKNTSAK